MTTVGTPGNRFESPRAVNDALRSVGYLADEGIAAVVFLADRLGKPVLVEGPAGTGKTQLAKSVSEMTGARLIRLQCYEGPRRVEGSLRMELQKAAAADPGGAGDPGRRDLAGTGRGHIFRALFDAAATAGSDPGYRAGRAA